MTDEEGEQVSAAEVYAIAATVGGDFEGHAVVGAGVEVRGVAGGLQEPMSFSPQTFEHGQTGCLVLWFTAKGVRFDPADKEELGGDVVRVSILKVDEATFLEPAVVADARDRQRKINDEGRRKIEESQGISRLNFAGASGDDGFDLATAHANGEHDTPDPDCPICSLSSDPDEENEQAVMVRQHLAGVHADSLRDGCVMCRTESEAVAREAQEDAAE